MANLPASDAQLAAWLGALSQALPMEMVGMLREMAHRFGRLPVFNAPNSLLDTSGREQQGAFFPDAIVTVKGNPVANAAADAQRLIPKGKRTIVVGVFFDWSITNALAGGTNFRLTDSTGANDLFVGNVGPFAANTHTFIPVQGIFQTAVGDGVQTLTSHIDIPGAGNIVATWWCGYDVIP